jgi:transposase
MQVAQLDTTVINYISEIKTEIQSQFEQQIRELMHQIHKLQEEAWDYRNKYLVIKEQHDLLIYKRFMRSSEQLPVNTNQNLLFPTEIESKQAMEEETKKPEEHTVVNSYSRKKCGRKPIDPSITRVPRIIDIPEDEKKCACGSELTKIGEEISEKLIYIPAQIIVDEIHRLKYACQKCEGTAEEGIKPTVRIAPVEPSIISRSIATSSLLSHILTSKFEDHVPYFRQEKQFKRMGISLRRQDMANWQQMSYKRLTHLLNLLKQTVKSGSKLQMDEVPVQVMKEEGRENTQKSYIWLARGGPPGKTVVWYNYFETRKAENARKFLQDYKGYLQTDGFESYDSAVKDLPDIIQVGCYAHCRRKFFEASKLPGGSELAEEGIKHIRKLYDLEHDLRSQGLSDDEFLEERKKGAQPILEDFKLFLYKLEETVSPSTLLGKAVKYGLSQWNKLTRYLDNPLLTPDNNLCENSVRPVVLGRKNWMQFGSPDGAESACGFYTLIETAKKNGYESTYYLKALFEKAPYASTKEDWEKLLPWNIFQN